jgi:hypothetical protein
VSLIVRLVVNREGQILSGQVGALSSTEQPQQWVRFRDAASLVEVVASLARAAIADTHQDTG